MERISALMDGECDHNEVARVVRQAKEQPELREAWSTYHLIGAAMRGERCTDNSRVVQAVRAKLDAEPTVLAPKRSIAEVMRRSALPGMAAAAAAVAAVTWVSLETYQAPVHIVPIAEVVVPSLVTGVEHASLVSLLPPPAIASPPPPIQLPGRRIDAYLEAHQEFSPSRTIQGLASYARTVSATSGFESGRFESSR